MAFCRAGEVSDRVASEPVARPGRTVATVDELAETHQSEKRPVEYAVGGHSVVVFVSPNCSQRLRPQDPINRSVIVASARKPALYLYNQAHIVISVIIVGVRIVVPVIRIRIEGGKTKGVDEDEPPIMETTEMMCAGHGAGRKTGGWPRHRRSCHYS